MADYHTIYVTLLEPPHLLFFFGFSDCVCGFLTRESDKFLSFFFPQSRDKDELELDFKRCWEEFRSSNSEKVCHMSQDVSISIYFGCVLLLQILMLSMLLIYSSFHFLSQEKERALTWTVEFFCRLEREHKNVAHLFSM